MPRIRAISVADLELLAAMHAVCFPDDPWDCAALSEVLAIPGAFGRLASVGGGAGEEPAGFLLALAVARQCEVVSLGVLPATRRRGVGRALLADLSRRARSRQSDSLFLEVAEDNSAALRLYESAGFERVGRRPDYYRRPGGIRVSAWTLRRLLGG